MTMPRQKPGKSRQDYGTPPELLAAIKFKLKIRQFALDAAATAENAVCPIFYTEEDNSLGPWKWAYDGWTWCNPPYGNIRPWVAKACSESIKGAQVAMLVPASPGSTWWKDWVDGFAYVTFLTPRLTFVGATDPYPKDCALLLYTPWGFTGHEIWNWKLANKGDTT